MPPTVTNRRTFLRRGCLIAAGATLTLCGGAAAVLAWPPRIDIASLSTGESTSGKRVLVAYGSKAGTTGEMALRIGQAIAARGAQVDVLPIDKAGDPAAYSAVVLGSAIRIGAVLPAVMDYLTKHQAALAARPLSVFISCMTLTQKSEDARDTVRAYLDPVRAVVQPAAEGLFAGAVLPERLPLYERLMVDSMKSPVGDFREWKEIETWASTVEIG